MDWLMRLLLTCLAISKLSNAEFFILSGPEYYIYDYIIIKGSIARDMFCVSDELNSSIVWNSNLDWEKSSSKRNEIFPAQVLKNDRSVYSENDDVTCWMNHTSPCSKHWSKDSQWIYVSTEQRPMSPVTDNRWEEFPEESMGQRFRNMGAIPSVGSQAISIRGSSTVEFAICNNQFTDKGVCFKIVIDGWKNTLTFISKCQNGIPYDINSKVDDECVTPLGHINGTFLSSIEWKHFVIKWHFGTIIMLTLYDTYSILVRYSEQNNESYFPNYDKMGQEEPAYFLFARTYEATFIKFHKYSYLLTTSTKSKLTSPKITTRSDRNICIEMSISLCENCQLTVDFIDSINQPHVGGTFKNEIGSNVYGLPTWRDIRVNKTFKEKLRPPFSLSINTLFINKMNTQNSSWPFWAISNVRRCYRSRMKVVQIQAFRDKNREWPSLTCQKLSADGTSSIIDSTNRRASTINSETRPLCDKGKIGSSCSISCSSLFQDNKNCKELFMCDESGCSCAQGFTMPYCEKECPFPTYGFECKQKCENCRFNDCDYATGKCRQGCENTENMLFLPPCCKTGIGSPPAPSIEVINSTCIRVHLSVGKDYKIFPTYVFFEAQKFDNKKSSFSSNYMFVHKNKTSIEEFFDKLNPGTHYKVVANVFVNNTVLPGEWANVTTPCSEYVALNFIILNDETSITVNTRADKQVSDYCPNMWYRVQLLKEKEVLFNESTPFPKVFTDLEPFTEYRIVISSENSNIIDKYVSTLESAPYRVENLELLSVSTNKIQFSWEPPIKTRGRLVNYTVVIQAYETLGCSQFKEFYNLSEKHTELEMQAVITDIAQSQYNYTFYRLRPYTRYQVTVCASTVGGQSKKSVLDASTQPIETPTEVFENLHCDSKQSGHIGATLQWSLPADCSTITGPIVASKLYLRKIGENFTVHETDSYNFPLEKSKFIGNENYEVLVYALRDFGRQENKTAFVGLNFTMPAREPPAVHNMEIIEVDTKNSTITLRWKPPKPPLNGVIDFYSINYCESYLTKCDSNATIVLHNEWCKLWPSRSGDICATIPLPSTTFIKVTAYNDGVKEGSEPVKTRVQRTELEPSGPSELRVVNINNITAELRWAHPLKSGGRLEEFQITVKLHNSSLKVKPWQIRKHSLKIGSDGYQPYYSTNIELFPASTFLISVNALTWLNVPGDKNETTYTISPYTHFDNNDLMPKANESSFISIQIPKIVNDVEGSRLIVTVQGLRYCDEAENTSKNVYSLLNIERTSNEFTWMAASVTKLKNYVGKEFRVGDGFTYGDAKNYILCPNEPYVISLFLVDDLKDPADDKRILDSVKTSPIYIGEPPINYAMWLVPMFLIFVVLALLIFIACRKKFPMNFLRNKPKTKMQENIPENMPLSNDFNRKSKLDEIESDVKMRDTKDPLYDNVFITEKKKTYLMPVKVEEFEEYFESVCKSNALHNEYQTLKSGPTRPCVYGSQREVKPKNRYANLFAYDETRVVLEKIADDPFSDYINANFITGYKNKEKAYIATQGPKPNTVIDFWRMVWQEKVQIICMMSNLLENGKVKCEEYWPSAIGKKILYGTIAVQFSSEIVHSDFTYRTFRVSSNNQETRTVEHLHYTTWPDHGVPSNPSSIVAFIKKLHCLAPGLKDPEAPPILVHCSAGVGRTGTLIVLDIAVQQALAEKVVDVFSIVLSVRSERMNMVDNEEQYLFLHLVLIEYFIAEDTRLVCDKGLAEGIREKKRHYLTYYQRILDTNWWNDILSSSQPTELSSRNRAKHRFPQSTVCINRLYLKRTIITDEDSNYIAATLVKDVFKHCQYITTQLPMPSTLADFWRMLAEFNVEYVLVLQLPNLEDPTYCELVPESQGFASTNYLRVIRQENSKEELQYYLKEKITIIDSSEPSKNQVVKIITYKYWPEASLPSPGDLVELWKVLDDFPKNNQSPIIVACRDGVTVSGLWLTLSYMLKRMTIDKECDIPLAARAIRRCRSDFINKPEHFEYLYDVALAWFDEIFQ